MDTVNMVPLIKKILIGAVGGSIDIALSIYLPVAGPILKGALEPVLDQLKQRLGGVAITSSDELADEAVSKFAEDEDLQKLLLTKLHYDIKCQVNRLTARAIELIEERKLDRAWDELQEGLSLVNDLLKETPSDVYLKLQLGYIYKTCTQVLKVQGQDIESEKFLSRASELFQAVKEEIPADQKTVQEIAAAINGLGNVYYERGELHKALENCRLATMLDPKNAYAWHDLFGCYHALAKVGEIHLEEMQYALTKLKETGLGLPGLSRDYMVQLEDYMSYYQ